MDAASFHLISDTQDEPGRPAYHGLVPYVIPPFSVIVHWLKKSIALLGHYNTAKLHLQYKYPKFLGGYLGHDRL